MIEKGEVKSVKAIRISGNSEGIKLVHLVFDGKERSSWFRSELPHHRIGAHYVAEYKEDLRIGRIDAICEITDVERVRKIPPILREAGNDDLEKVEKNNVREKKAFSECLNCIEKYTLPMRLVDVETHLLDERITFYFTSEERIDFRALVKNLAGIFKCRIEMKQIGLREKWRRLGDFGSCGRPLCCRSFLSGFEPVTTKMAKEQELPYDYEKITGMCGKLRCCLRYELAFYRKKKEED